MLVDSYRYLPRSFRELYEEMSPIDDTSPVWAPFEKRLAEANVTLLSSGGLYLEGEQEPFDLEREKQEPNWGDPTSREIPHDVGAVGVAHLHVNNEDARADHHVVLPTGPLQALVDEGLVGGATERHFSVMGYQGRGEHALDGWTDETAPTIIDRLRDLRSDAVLLAPV